MLGLLILVMLLGLHFSWTKVRRMSLIKLLSQALKMMASW
jgi:hypothetical protein